MMRLDPILARMMDANANRAREALRMLEDVARFGMNDQALAASLKGLRHTLAGAMQAIHADDALLFRDTPADVGTTIKTTAEFQRTGIADIVTAAGKRLSEALRVLEECAKAIDPAAAATLERARYQGYTLEQTITIAARQAGQFPKAGLYVLLTEALCKRPWEETLDAVLAGGAAMVQLREKSLEDAELLRRAMIVAEKCRAAGALAILNDRPDIALLSHSHGVHVGQMDLPVAQVRKFAGHDFIVGISTERLDQAQPAIRDGATYIAVGPMFPTCTKEKPRLAGPAYAREATENIPLPLVAIGGITVENLPELIAAGIRCVAVCSAVISHPDPASQCRRFVELLNAAPNPRV